MSELPVLASVDWSSDDSFLSSCGVVYFSRAARDKLMAEISQTLGRDSDSETGTGTALIPIKDLLELIATYAVSPAEYVTTVCHRISTSTSTALEFRPYHIGRIRTGTGTAGCRDLRDESETTLVVVVRGGPITYVKLSGAGALLSVTPGCDSFKNCQGFAVDPRTGDGSFFVCETNRVYHVSGVRVVHQCK